MLLCRGKALVSAGLDVGKIRCDINRSTGGTAISLESASLSATADVLSTIQIESPGHRSLIEVAKTDDQVNTREYASGSSLEAISVPSYWWPASQSDSENAGETVPDSWTGAKIGWGIGSGVGSGVRPVVGGSMHSTRPSFCGDR